MRIRVTYDKLRDRWKVESRTPLNRRREYFTGRSAADERAAEIQRDERAGAVLSKHVNAATADGGCSGH